LSDQDYSDESGRQAEAQPIINRIHREAEKHGVRGVGDRPDHLGWDDPQDRERLRARWDDPTGEAILPGFGELGKARTAQDDCGEVHPFICDECGHYVEFGRTCQQSVCSRCGAVWCRNLAIQKAAKLRRLRKEKHHHTPGREHQKLHHLIISPPIDWFLGLAGAGVALPDALDHTLEVVKDILAELRAQGLVVRHSYRGERENGAVAGDATADDDRNEWQERLFSEREWYDDVREELAWMPHFHAVVVADRVEGGDLTKQVEAETGWVIHRIADENNISLEEDSDMARAVTYCLSHADIVVDLDGPNDSVVREVGSFEGDPVRSSGRFTPQAHDLAWSDSVVREAARDTLGLHSGSTDCGADIPPVSDPDELARRVLEDLFPEDDRRQDVSEDLVLNHIAEGNITVDVDPDETGAEAVTVRDAFGDPVGAGGWGGGSVPEIGGSATYDGADAPPLVDEGRNISSPVDVDDQDEHDHDHGAESGCSCDGKLIPLEEARRRGLLDDEEWTASAPHVEEAREADREWPDDLEPWQTEAPGSAVSGVG
jgi:hypothetical protein